MTLLEIVNSVMRRLREDTVSDLSSPYARLIAEFVADIHKEVVDAHDWSKMDKGVMITIAPGRTVYDLSTGSPDLYSGWTGLNEGAQLRYRENTQPVAYLYANLSAYNSGTVTAELAEGSEQRVAEAVNTRSGYSAQPSEFSFLPAHPDYNVAGVQFDANPDATYLAYFRFHNPELEIDPSAPSRVIVAPSKPLILGAVYLALNERGEEMGEPGHVAEQKYRVALAAEIERDALRLGRTNQYEFHRD